MQDDHNVVKAMQAQWARYAALVRAKGEDHALGPPHQYVWAGLIQAVVDEGSGIGNLTLVGLN
eukprot:5725443-Lingulodinium_polyedra.AAC.1